MTNVNDTHGKLENQWESLREADIDDQDREAIREFDWNGKATRTARPIRSSRT